MREKKEMLLSYVKANIAPILVDFIFGQDLEDSIVLPANIDIKELNGYYDDINFMPPKWLNQILNTNTSKLLVIDKIDSYKYYRIYFNNVNHNASIGACPGINVLQLYGN